MQRIFLGKIEIFKERYHAKNFPSFLELHKMVENLIYGSDFCFSPLYQYNCQYFVGRKFKCIEAKKFIYHVHISHTFSCHIHFYYFLFIEKKHNTQKFIDCFVLMITVSHLEVNHFYHQKIVCVFHFGSNTLKVENIVKTILFDLAKSFARFKQLLSC